MSISREEDKEKIQALADMLISTLGDMTPREADEVVKRVALTMYNDLLGIEGEIQQGSFRLCFIGGISHITNTTFKPLEKSH